MKVKKMILSTALALFFGLGVKAGPTTVIEVVGALEAVVKDGNITTITCDAFWQELVCMRITIDGGVHSLEAGGEVIETGSPGEGYEHSSREIDGGLEEHEVILY